MPTISRAPGDAPPAASGSATDAELLARFTSGRDEAAFSALVGRYAPLVLGVCRRVLGDLHAAEDALQATFLILARKAGVIDRPDQLTGWLHGVAYRVALKARTAAARRQGHESRVKPMPPPAAPELDLAWQELRRVLDEELARLPEPDRSLLVLCYLEGLTHEQAAARLGCPQGSVAWRLNRGREELRRRLERRGVCLGVGPVGLLAATGRAEAVTADLVNQAAAFGRAAGDVSVGAHVLSLAEVVLRDLDRGPRRRPPWWLLALALGTGLGVTAATAATAAWAGWTHPADEPPGAVESCHHANPD